MVSWPDAAPDRRSMVEQANKALYGAKQAGKDRVVVSEALSAA